MSCIIKKLSLVVCFVSTGAYGGDYYSPSALSIPNNGKVIQFNGDLSIFEENSVPEGDYKVDIYINKKIVGNKIVSFSLSDEGKLTPCLTIQELIDYGIKPGALVHNIGQCFHFGSVTDISFAFEPNTKKLLVSAPQVYIDEQKLHEAKRHLWDDGITALILNYDLSGFNSKTNGSYDDHYYANVRSQLNLGPWRIHNYSTYNKDNYNSKFNNLRTYANRAVREINSELVVGEIGTSSMIFDSISIIGARLRSDDQMLSNRYASYVPEITGIAGSESVITIKQGDSVIYKKSVPPGPYSIKDYNAPYRSEDLFVTVVGADGVKDEFYVPYISGSSLVRKGDIKYDLSTGKYNGSSNDKNGWVFNGEFRYGLTNIVTVLNGVEVSNDYKSAAVGASINLGEFGFVSTNVIHAEAKIQDKTKKGNALKFEYQKDILDFGTSFNLRGTEYLSRNFYTYGEDFFDNNANRLKRDFSASISQPVINNTGYITSTMTMYDYYNSANKKSYSVGYRHSFNKFSTGLYFSYFSSGSEYDDGKYNISFNVNIPFSFYDSYNFASYNMSRQSNNKFQQTAQIGGMTGENNSINWSAYQGYEHDKNEYSGGVSAGYSADVGDMRVGYSYSPNVKNINYGLSGGFVVTQYGAAFTPQLQGTNALVRVEGTQGVKLSHSRSGETNAFGLTVLPGLTAFRENDVALHPESIPKNIEIENRIKAELYPTRGALILADFDTIMGHKIYTKLLNKKGEIPMGTTAHLNGTTFIVSESNNLYFVAEKTSGQVKLKWMNNDVLNECMFNFDLTGKTDINGIYIFNSTCE